MRRFLLALVLVFSLAGVRAHAQDERPVAEAIVMIGDGCTGFLIRPSLVVTASHCVGALGGETYAVVLNGQTLTRVKGRTIWDSHYQDVTGNPAIVDAALDLALVALEAPQARTVTFDERTPPPGTVVTSISMAAGIYQWPASLTVVGLFWHTRIDMVLVYRGDTYPGASGSPTLLNGKVMGIITHGVTSAVPPILMGAPSYRLVRAVADLDQYGIMRPCERTNAAGQKVFVVCRGDVRTQ